MDPRTCPTCGAAIDADHPEGLCPACLLKKALESGWPGRALCMQCPTCQSALGEDARFCAYCGAPAPAVPAAGGDPVWTALEAKLKGQYRLGRMLGLGGMGTVYLARDLTLDREVAIKVIKAEGDALEVHNRFRREARMAARLSHPNIVPLHAFGEVEGMPYFVMGYVRGESLETRLRRDGKLPEEEARRVVAEIADALDHAHRQGIVHRDIKPGNVLLDDESGRALLTDFGVAKALGQGETLTSAGAVVGTPHYMSPEQASGRADLDGRSDIYSLGVMAFAMLAGRLPFEGNTAGDILKKHLTQEPPPLRSLASMVSDSTVKIVDRCLAKDPGRRWPDARSLKLALGTIEEGQLPDALREVQGQGILGLVIALLLLFILTLFKPPAFVLRLNSGLIVFVYIFVLLRLRLEGFSMGQSQAAIWTEPAWWPFWYPRALRRPGNVWDRLPASVRQFRWWAPAFALYVGICMVRPDSFHSMPLFILRLAGLAVFVVLWFILLARARGEVKRKGFTWTDTERIVMSMAPSRVGFWARPHITALLAPAPSGEPSRRADSPHDQLQSILRHAGELSGLLRPLGAEAAVAARQLLASIEHADGEIAELARNIEPGEETRLADKIESLVAAPGRDDESAPMRLLLEKQLELIRELSGRIEEAREARSRRIEMLKTLNLHLASLRARSAETPTELRSLSDRVRALCDDIGRQARGEGGSGGDTVAMEARSSGPDDGSQPS